MATKIHGFLLDTDVMPTVRQRLIMRAIFGVLIDLVVLGLCDQFSDSVTVTGFSWALLAAILLQALLKVTLTIEHHVALFFNARKGPFMRFMRFFGAWFVMFISKFIILEAISFAFGHRVRFEGMMHGVVPLVLVVTIMVIAEEAIVRFVRWAR